VVISKCSLDRVQLPRLSAGWDATENRSPAETNIQLEAHACENG
jgi:hypothetical protein